MNWFILLRDSIVVKVELIDKWWAMASMLQKVYYIQYSTSNRISHWKFRIVDCMSKICSQIFLCMFFIEQFHYDNNDSDITYESAFYIINVVIKIIKPLKVNF